MGITQHYAIYVGTITVATQSLHHQSFKQGSSSQKSTGNDGPSFGGRLVRSSMSKDMHLPPRIGMASDAVTNVEVASILFVSMKFEM